MTCRSSIEWLWKKVKRLWKYSCLHKEENEPAGWSGEWLWITRGYSILKVAPKRTRYVFGKKTVLQRQNAIKPTHARNWENMIAMEGSFQLFSDGDMHRGRFVVKVNLTIIIFQSLIKALGRTDSFAWQAVHHGCDNPNQNKCKWTVLLEVMSDLVLTLPFRVNRIKGLTEPVGNQTAGCSLWPRRSLTNVSTFTLIVAYTSDSSNLKMFIQSSRFCVQKKTSIFLSQSSKLVLNPWIVFAHVPAV